MRHQSVAIRGDELYGKVFTQTDADWRCVIGVDSEELDRIDEIGSPTREQLEERDKIEANLIKALDQTWWLVSWPDHVICPRFNGDANYRRCSSEQDARESADAVYGETQN